LTSARILPMLVTLAPLACGVALGHDAWVVSQAEAVKRALDYTGLGVQPHVTVSAEATTVPADDDVPFLRLAGKPAWRVTLDNVTLAVRGRTGKVHENPTIRRLDVWLDRADGRLLKIVSPHPVGVDPPTSPSSASLEGRLEGMGQRFEGVPAEMPRINFMQGLQSITEGIGGTSMAKQVEAIYVLLRHTISEDTPYMPCRKAPCPRWIITLRYLPPTPFPGPPAPGGGRTTVYRRPFENYEHEVDPTTGKWLGATTAP